MRTLIFKHTNIVKMCGGTGGEAWTSYGHNQNDKYTSMKVYDGNVVVAYEHGNFTGNNKVFSPGDHRDLRHHDFNDKISSFRILPDCNDWNNNDLVWEGDCDNYSRYFPNLNENRKKYCNKNKENAFKQKCDPFPDLRNLYNKCANYGISYNNCNDTNITNMENKCVSYGFMEQTTKNIIGSNVCNQTSINDFLTDCRKYIPTYIPTESGCTSSGLADAKSRKTIADNAELERIQTAQDAEAARIAQAAATDVLVQAQQESDTKRAEETKEMIVETKKQREESQKKTESMILSIVDPSALPDDLQQRALKVQDDDNNQKMMMIIAIVVVMLLSSSSSMLMTLMII